ncbi:DUF4397 domain-containing protein [Streptomyces phyllanthi]|uniref:DUF4397 domain-containing protein n=1 Tax=Streptomyces phyllanthi TaxID=1803180 RepID=A0A5N8WCD3_9ACTN|nr:DUF4397 domain-containing protein [Streptomyces phyllanthi]MPY44969.1 DUF4397 domain-containing protein [Streptomyces phyllanthi]
MSARLTRAALALGAAGLLGLTVLPATSAGAAQNAAQENATVTVFHGIPGTTVDVYANGKRLLSGFTPGSLSSPLSLPADSYDIEVFKAGASPSGTPVVERTVEVTEGANASVTANLNVNGRPALNTFVNDTSRVPDGQSRLVVRHVADAPAVDVRAGGTPVFKNVQNPEQEQTEVDAGSVNADVVLTGTTTVVIGPATLNLESGATTVVYAWGSADAENLALKVQQLSSTS